MQHYVRLVIRSGMFAVMGACMVACGSQQGRNSTPRPESLTDSQAPVTPQQPDSSQDVRAGENSLAIAAARDCVYVQWCDEPGSRGTICRLRSGCKYNDTTINECKRDTKAVCGSGYPKFPFFLY